MPKAINNIDFNNISALINDDFKQVTHLQRKNSIDLSLYSPIKNIKLEAFHDTRDIILICDDTSLVLNALENILNNNISIREKYQIKKITDGSYILTNLIENELSETSKIKLVISDENMEYMNGSEAMRIIRYLQEKKKLNTKSVFISLTAFEDPAMRENITKSGFDRIYSKPMKKSDIVEIMTEYKLL